MSSEIRINGNRPAAAGGSPAPAKRAIPNGRQGVNGASSIGPAQGGRPARGRNPRDGQGFSCLGCIGTIFRAIFRCLFWWCLPARRPRREDNQNLPVPNLPPRVDQPAVQPQPANPGQNNVAAPVQDAAQPALNENQARVRLFLEQFPEPKGDEDERSEEFVTQFKEQIPPSIQKAARDHVILSHRGQIRDVQDHHRNIRDDHKGPARHAPQVTADEASLILMESGAQNVIATVRIFLEESIGIIRPGDDE